MLTAMDSPTLVRAHYEAFNKRDIDKNLSLVTDDVKWTNIPFNVTHTGRSGIRDFLGGWTTAMPDCKVEVLNVFASDDWTVGEFIGRGTHTGPLVGPQGTIPATQKKLELKFCEIFKIKNGQIAEARVYFDAATMLRQLGVLPQTMAPSQPVPSNR
jgi:steroid delta-isomerase-like uncharacterized protein